MTRSARPTADVPMPASAERLSRARRSNPAPTPRRHRWKGEPSWVGSDEPIGRDNARAKHANALAPLEQEKALIEARMLDIDSGVAQLEGYILQHAEA